jgi:D-alanyl-D-alanine dipeptidase
MKNLPIILIIAGFLTACSTDKGADEVSMKENPNSSTELKSDQEDLPVLEKTLIEQGLVNIEELIPNLRVELKYSTTDNFFGQDVYGDLTRAYLQPEVAEKLKKATEMLQTEYPNLTLLVYDGARPLSVQQILWDNLEKPDSIKPLYVADPKIGGLHNYGVAVDLTIFDVEAGKPLDMGTAYDFFGFEAYPDRELEMMAEGKITRAQVANREILRKVMRAAGFSGIGSEWWHFNAYSREEAGKKFELVK